MEKTKVVSKGTSFGGLLTILFIALKLCNVINWSWVWVLAPIWIGWGLALIFTVIALIIAALIKS